MWTKLKALGKEQDHGHEVEHGWTKELQPKWTSNAVTASDGTEVDSTEEKVQQFVAYVNTGKSTPEILRMADKVEMGGNEGKQERTKMYTKGEIQKEGRICLQEKKLQEGCA